MSFVYNVLTPPDPQRSSLQEMFVFLSRVLAKHTQHALRAGRGGCNIVIGYQNILHAWHASHGIPCFSQTFANTFVTFNPAQILFVITLVFCQIGVAGKMH